jgi:hypothetical protein
VARIALVAQRVCPNLRLAGLLAFALSCFFLRCVHAMRCDARVIYYYNVI